MRGSRGWDRECVAPRQKVVILTGDQHPAHHWKDTTLALMHAMELDPRCRVEVSESPEAWLSDASHLHGIDLLVMNYCNWESPGWGAQARERLDQFVRRGGGLAVIHFANGAFHASLPGAETSDWPGYQKLVRRVWDHDGPSGHDPYGSLKCTFRRSGIRLPMDCPRFRQKMNFTFIKLGTARCRPWFLRIHR